MFLQGVQGIDAALSGTIFTPYSVLIATLAGLGLGAITALLSFLLIITIPEVPIGSTEEDKE